MDFIDLLGKLIKSESDLVRKSRIIRRTVMLSRYTVAGRFYRQPLIQTLFTRFTAYNCPVHLAVIVRNENEILQRVAQVPRISVYIDIRSRTVRCNVVDLKATTNRSKNDFVQFVVRNESSKQMRTYRACRSDCVMFELLKRTEIARV